MSNICLTLGKKRFCVRRHVIKQTDTYQTYVHTGKKTAFDTDINCVQDKHVELTDRFEIAST